MNDEIKLSGVLAKGYGLSPKLVMTDTSISIEAKAIYCYLSSFCGNGTTAFPGVELIKHHLNISKNRFYKYRNELIERGYIKVTRRHDGNRAISNIYTLCLQIEDIQNEDIQIEDIQNEDTNNNSFTNISSINNSINSASGKKPNVKHKYGEYKNVLLTDNELSKLKERFSDYENRIKQLDEGIELKGYKYKSHYLAIIKWAEKEKPNEPTENPYSHLKRL